MTAPDKIGRYSVLQRLGRGGMAEVFLAEHDGPAGFKKTVVIKRVLRDRLGDEGFVDMFLREARVAARLNHPNVVQVFELERDGDDWLIVMEHVDGLTLRRAARRAWAHGEAMPMEVVVRAIADAARGLHYAHTWADRDGRPSPLVHRDISPDNLMMTTAGITKVLDFGVAKVASEDVLTKTGEIKGKIPFMSPEQLEGRELDGRSDIWSLGISMYWLLTGERPFDADNDVATIRAIVDKPLPEPRSINPLIPPALQKVLVQMLEKDRERRLATGALVADRLLALLGSAAADDQPAAFIRGLLPLPDVAGVEKRTVAASRPRTSFIDGRTALDGADPVVGADHIPTIEAVVDPTLSSAPASTTVMAPSPKKQRTIVAALLAGIGVVAALGVAAVALNAPAASVVDAGAVVVAPVPTPPPPSPPPPPPPPPEPVAVAVDAGVMVPKTKTPATTPKTDPPPKTEPPKTEPPKTEPPPLEPPKPSSSEPTLAEDQAIVEGCDKPCAVLWRQGKGSAERRESMAHSCARICRGG